MTFKPTMALLMRNLCQGDKQKVQDGNNKKKQKTQQKDPTFFICMFIVYDVTILTISLKITERLCSGVSADSAALSLNFISATCQKS